MENSVFLGRDSERGRIGLWAGGEISKASLSQKKKRTQACTNPHFPQLDDFFGGWVWVRWAGEARDWVLITIYSFCNSATYWFTLPHMKLFSLPLSTKSVIFHAVFYYFKCLCFKLNSTQRCWNFIFVGRALFCVWSTGEHCLGITYRTSNWPDILYKKIFFL